MVNPPSVDDPGQLPASTTERLGDVEFAGEIIGGMTSGTLLSSPGMHSAGLYGLCNPANVASMIAGQGAGA